MQKTLLSAITALTFTVLMTGCETEQLEGDTVRTPMAVPEESAHTGSAAQTAKQQAEEETTAQSAPTVSGSTAPASEPVSYWDEKPAIDNTDVVETESVESATTSTAILPANVSVPEEQAGENIPTASTTLSEADNEGSISIEANTLLVVELPGNPTTGYTWSVESFDSSVLSLEGHNYTPTATDRAGSGGTFHFNFKALTSGSTTIKLKYARPWEKDVPPAKTFSNDVEVE